MTYSLREQQQAPLILLCHRHPQADTHLEEIFGLCSHAAPTGLRAFSAAGYWIGTGRRNNEPRPLQALPNSAPTLHHDPKRRLLVSRL